MSKTKFFFAAVIVYLTKYIPGYRRYCEGDEIMKPKPNWKWEFSWKGGWEIDILRKLGWLDAFIDEVIKRGDAKAYRS